MKMARFSTISVHWRIYSNLINTGLSYMILSKNKRESGYSKILNRKVNDLSLRSKIGETNKHFSCITFKRSKY